VNCMIAVLGLIAPRVIAVAWWLVDPARWDMVFAAAFLPIVGVLFLPWTTLMVVLFWTNTGFPLIGWIIIFFAFMGDLATYGGGFLGNRDQLESYYR
jgi:hypothetical protein